MSKIIRLESKNVKRLKAVEVQPDGDVVVIGGRNEQGKSSLLDSIMFALGGKSLQCEVPIRNGEEEASTTIETDDLIITRLYRRGAKDVLKVKTRDGAQFTSPQTSVLDKIVGPISFDPLQFSKMNEKDQISVLQKLFNIDTTEIDERRQILYDERKQVNAEARFLESQYAVMEYWDDVGTEKIETGALSERLERAQLVNLKNKEVRQALDDCTAAIEIASNRKYTIEKQIEDLQRQLDDYETELEELRTNHREYVDRVGLLVDKDEQAIVQEYEKAQETNEKILANAQREQKKEMILKKKEQSGELTRQISEIDKERSAMFECAELPVTGLSFEGGRLLDNGVPFSQSSTARRLKVSCAMGMAQSKGLNIMLIREGAILDEDSMQVLYDVAKASETQIWVEVVGKRDDCDVIIEDGQVYRDPEDDDTGPCFKLET